MFRQFDFECETCGTKRGDLVEVPQGSFLFPKTTRIHCRTCDDHTVHVRVMSAPAKYMGESVVNVPVYGGKFDTMGNQQLPQYTEMPGLAAAQSAAEEAIAKAGVSSINDARERKQAIADATRHIDFPSAAAYVDHQAKPENKEIAKERKRVAESNAQKQKRAAAIRRGENINMRTDKCANDPKVTQ